MDNRLQMDPPEGVHIGRDYTKEFDEMSEAYYIAVSEEAKAYKEMHNAKARMDAAGMQVELSIISDMGGDEKSVGKTEAARQREYALAREKSTHYKEARDFYYDTRTDYKYHQGMVRLMDLRAQFLIATAK